MIIITNIRGGGGGRGNRTKEKNKHGGETETKKKEKNLKWSRQRSILPGLTFAWTNFRVLIFVV